MSFRAHELSRMGFFLICVMQTPYGPGGLIIPSILYIPHLAAMWYSQIPEIIFKVFAAGRLTSVQVVSILVHERPRTSSESGGIMARRTSCQLGTLLEQQITRYSISPSLYLYIGWVITFQARLVGSSESAEQNLTGYRFQSQHNPLPCTQRGQN
jgi:hypothetical protein